MHLYDHRTRVTPFLHWNVTSNPTAAWTLQQLREAIASDHPYRFLVHDRDSIYTQALDTSIANLRLRVLKTPYRSPKAKLRPTKSKIFWISQKAAGRRRINLRSEIITLFRYVQIPLRALPRDRKTESELVLRDQTQRKPVEAFSPEEFETFLGVA